MATELWFTLRGSYTVPDGTVENDDDSMTLPTGQIIKLWETFELITENPRDLGTQDLADLGVHLDDGSWHRDVEIVAYDDPQ